MAKSSAASASSKGSHNEVSADTDAVKPLLIPQAPSNGMPDLDRVIHERVRLGIISALAANESLTFNDLKKLLDTTDGNLSVHARKLEDAGYIRCTKSFEGRMPRTEYRLTDDGNRALTKYIDHMEALIQAMRVHQH